jgi:hypothetical protein
LIEITNFLNGYGDVKGFQDGIIIAEVVEEIIDLVNMYMPSVLEEVYFGKDLSRSKLYRKACSTLIHSSWGTYVLIDHFHREYFGESIAWRYALKDACSSGFKEVCAT